MDTAIYLGVRDVFICIYSAILDHSPSRMSKGKYDFPRLPVQFLPCFNKEATGVDPVENC